MGCQSSRLVRSQSADNTAADQPQAAPAPDTSATAPVDKSAATGTVEASTMSNKSEAGTSAAPVCPSEAEDEAPGDIVAPPSGGAPKLANEHRYNSFERPARSSLRPSLDIGSGGGGAAGGSRRVSMDKRVGFAAPPPHPAVDRQSLGTEDSSSSSVSYAHADSVSLKKIVDLFYERALAHPELGRFFVGIDMGKLKRHQVKFMALAFGGKELVREEDPNLNLRKIHYRLIRDQGLTLAHWEAFVDLFEEVLGELPAIPPETRATAMASIRTTRVFFVPPEQEDLVPKSLADLPSPPEPASPAGAAAAAAGAEGQVPAS